MLLAPAQVVLKEQDRGTPARVDKIYQPIPFSYFLRNIEIGLAGGARPFLYLQHAELVLHVPFNVVC